MGCVVLGSAMVMDGGDGMFYSLVIVGIGVEVELGGSSYILCKPVEMKMFIVHHIIFPY